MASGSRSASSPVVSYRDSHRRWFTLRYLSSRPYPASVTEIGEYVASHLDSSREEVESKLVERDLPALRDCNVIRHDSYTDLVCLFDKHGTFEKYVRRAANAGAILQLTPPKAATGWARREGGPETGVGLRAVAVVPTVVPAGRRPEPTRPVPADPAGDRDLTVAGSTPGRTAGAPSRG